MHLIAILLALFFMIFFVFYLYHACSPYASDITIAFMYIIVDPVLACFTSQNIFILLGYKPLVVIDGSANIPFILSIILITFLFMVVTYKLYRGVRQ